MFENRAGRRGKGTSADQRAATAPGKRTLTEGLSAASGPEEVQAVAQAGISGAGAPLPYLDLVQASFGRHDVSGVRAHDDTAARGAAEQIGATAYATGDHVAFAGAPSLHTVAHEAAHVVQQRGGVQLKGGVGAAGDRHEQRADAVADLVVQGRSAEALLDEDAGGAGAQTGASHAVQHQVQLQEPPPPTGQPTQAPQSRSAITIDQFITLVEGEEARWPVAEQTQTALMITRLRKIFYGTPGWDQYLIPGAASVSSGYTIGEQEIERESLDLLFPVPDAEIVRTRQTVTDSNGQTPAIASQQEVLLRDGHLCDIGHVFAGLDAFNHQTSVSAPLQIATVADNVGAVTWTGDLGSVAAEVVFASMNAGRPLEAEEGRAILEEYAPFQDMLGNIDAYGMASAFDITDNGGRKVSDLLREYYLGESTTPGGDAREHRHTIFCRETGLRGWTGSAFSNEDEWVDRWSIEVGAAAALYIGANVDHGRNPLVMRDLGQLVLDVQQSSLPRALVQGFLDSLKPLVVAEQ